MKSEMTVFLVLVAVGMTASQSHAIDFCYGYLHRGEYEKAVDECTKSINAGKQSAHVDYFNRGNAYVEKGQLDQAIADYGKAIELNPWYDSAYSNRGNAYSAKGELDNAMADYTKAIELNPQNEQAHNNLGSLYLEKGQYAEAEKEIKKALELNPDGIPATITMAEYYSLMNNGDEACRWLRKGIEKGFEDWDYVKTHKVFDNIRDISCYRDIMQRKK